MTASKGVGRGKGGGRPRKDALPKAKSAPSVSRKIDEAARKEVERLQAVASTGVLAPAPDLVPVAYATLLDVMTNSPADASRVSAAKGIIDLARAAEAAAAEAAGMTGKKAQARIDASFAEIGTDWDRLLN